MSDAATTDQDSRSFAWFGSRRLVAAIFVVAVAVVPLLWSGNADEAYAGVKVAALRVILAAALVAMWAQYRITGTETTIRVLRPFDLALAVFVAWNLVAFAASPNHRQSFFGEDFQFQGLLTLGLYVVSFALARSAFIDRRRFRLLFMAAVLGGLLVGAYAILQELGLDPYWNIEFGGAAGEQRVFASIGEPNALAAYLVFAIGLALAFVAGRGIVGKIAGAVAVGVMVVAVALTFSRGGYLGLAAAAVVFVIGLAWSSAVSRQALAGAVVAVLAAAAIAVAAIGPVRDLATDVWDRASTLGDRAELEDTSRIDLWKVGLKMAVENPIVGVGHEMYPELFDQYDSVLDRETAERFARLRVESPHNLFIAIAVGAGFPALAAYLAMVVVFVIVVAQEMKYTDRPEVRVTLAALLAAFAGYFVSNSFMTAEVAGSWLAWVMMGAGLGFLLNQPLPQPHPVSPPG